MSVSRIYLGEDGALRIRRQRRLWISSFVYVGEGNQMRLMGWERSANQELQAACLKKFITHTLERHPPRFEKKKEGWVEPLSDFDSVV